MWFSLMAQWVKNLPAVQETQKTHSPFVGVFPMTQPIKNLPAMQETQEMWVRSLGREDPLEEKMATHFSILT